MIILDKRHVIMLHEELIRETGGSQGIRDEGLLDSALAAPFGEYGGVPAYPTVEHKAARLGYGLTKNHAFLDGNKRIGAHAMLVFLSLNHVELQYAQDELARLFLKVADGTVDEVGLYRWIIVHEIF